MLVVHLAPSTKRLAARKHRPHRRILLAQAPEGNRADALCGDFADQYFDEARVASIGALALAASNPNVVYVGTGEETVGNGMYRSDDAGKTWKHIGLEETRYITGIIVDPFGHQWALMTHIEDVSPGELQRRAKAQG